VLRNDSGGLEETSHKYRVYLYRKGIISIIVLTILISFFLPSISSTQPISRLQEDGLSGLMGEGTTEDPYQIRDVRDLQRMNEELNAHYKMVSHVNAAETEGWNDGEGFDPVGDEDNPFTGTFDGSGYEIRNLYIQRPESDHPGLFSHVDNGDVRDVSIVGAEVYGSRSVGALVGLNSGTITDSRVSGRVDGAFEIGLLVGSNDGVVKRSYTRGRATGLDFVGGISGSNTGRLEGSNSDADVRGDGAVGGAVGINEGKIKNTAFLGTVTGDWDIGGIVGENFAEVERSYSSGSVLAAAGAIRVGGVIGRNRGELFDSYSTGPVEGYGRVGGVAGLNDDILTRTYSVGHVDGRLADGGLVGGNNGNVTDSFWDVDTSGMDNSDGGTGKTTGEMKHLMTYTSETTGGLERPWDFVGDPNDDDGDEDTWDMDGDGIVNDGYPYLTGNLLQVNISVTGEGDVYIEPKREGYMFGEQVTLQVFPEEGWDFIGWTGDHEGVEKEIEVTLKEDLQITAIFDERKYELTIETVGEGSVSSYPDKDAYADGEMVELEADPEDGWRFKGWKDIEDDEPTLNITMSRDKTITAYFEELKYDLDLDIEGDGHVEIYPDKESYTEKENVTLRARADDGWSFVEWTGDHESESENITLQMDDDKDITAVFQEEKKMPGFNLHILIPSLAVAVLIYIKRSMMRKRNRSK